MESTFKLLATDRQAQILFNNYCVKLMEFKNEIIYPWRVTLRHKEELGKLRGVYSFEILALLSLSLSSCSEYFDKQQSKRK